MASYDVEHNISPTNQRSFNSNDDSTSTSQQQQQHHRPDLTEFLSALASMESTSNTTTTNPTSTSTNQSRRPNNNPQNNNNDNQPSMSEVYLSLANAFSQLQHDDNHPSQSSNPEDETNPLNSIISSLLLSARNPPSRPQGVDQEFLDTLERIRSRKALQAAGECPICGGVFVEQEWPLVVRLPCWKTTASDSEPHHQKKDSRKNASGGAGGSEGGSSGGQGGSQGGQGHVFDLECIAAWLKLNRTCPIDRIDLVDAKRQRREDILREAKRGAAAANASTTESADRKGEAKEEKQEEREEEEEEWDGMFA